MSAQAACTIIQQAGLSGAVDGAVVLGTGLNDIAQGRDVMFDLSYEDLLGFPKPSVSGHAGRLLGVKIDGRTILFLQGRGHFYEDGDARAMAVPLETLSLLGCKALLLTAACGSLRHDMRPGDLMMLRDHINLGAPNPLIGVKGDARFVSLVDAYDHGLCEQLRKAAQDRNLPLHEGVYMWFSGPSFETPAEIRMARILGADAVGMSVVPEVILARYYGLRMAAVGMMTNYAAGFDGGAPTHEETRRVGAQGAVGLKRLIDQFLGGLNHV